MLNKTVEMYNDGYELEEITEEIHLTVVEIIETLKKFTGDNKIVRGTKTFTFTNDFRQLLINRYQSGFSLYSIANELGISTSTVSKYLKRAGIDTKKKDNKRYEVLDWDNFEQCPTCKSKRNVRNLGLHNQEVANNEKPTHSLCLSCNTEWYKEEGETRKVLWQVIN
jgi:transposase-like protein